MYPNPVNNMGFMRSGVLILGCYQIKRVPPPMRKLVNRAEITVIGSLESCRRRSHFGRTQELGVRPTVPGARLPAPRACSSGVRRSICTSGTNGCMFISDEFGYLDHKFVMCDFGTSGMIFG